MFYQTDWFVKLRAILELLYFVSGIAIAVAAVWALQQIGLTKKIAQKNARRESVKLAAELCKYFAETVAPQMTVAADEHNNSNLGYLKVSAQPSFVLKDGEIVSNNFDPKLLPSGPKHSAGVKLVNLIEAFAIPFVAGVADEEIGYQETAFAFCQAVQVFMPLIYQLRVTSAGRFESTVKLYEIWSGRTFAKISGPVLKVLQDAVKKGESGQIKSLD
jgi:hypothetical protein